MKKYPSAVFSLITGPVRVENSDGRVVLTHLQKYSHLGYMLTFTMWKWIPVPTLHLWLFWKLQEGNDKDGWKPDTERGFYTRTPGFRWDADLGMIWTWGYFNFGGHWD